MVRLCFPMMNERNRRIFDETGGADFAYSMRCRRQATGGSASTCCSSWGTSGLVARRVNNFVPDFEGLYLPPIMVELCKFDQGMVLLAGVTGSGKSTTIASMLNWINANYRKHILTLEDPIEFVFTEDKCLINQREIGLDVKDFENRHEARRARRSRRDAGGRNARSRNVHDGHPRRRDGPPGVRHDPRLERADARSAVSSTCFRRTCTPRCAVAMAFNMKGIVAQKLLPSIKEGVGRVPTVEIMTFNATIRKLILEEKDDKLGDAIRMSEKEGMQDFTMSLKDLVDRDLIDRATAFEVAPNVEALKMALKGIAVAQPGIL